MSPDNFNPGAKPSKEENRKGGGGQNQNRQDQPNVNCPRCDSPNTKFCYYNNYSLTQPRHFCKTCRRYWTKGGALRNVPIGGGCRKSKKHNKSSSSSSASASRLSVFGDHFSSGESSDQIGLKFFHGGTNNNSNNNNNLAMDFQLGSSSLSLIPRLQYPNPNSIYTQFSISANNNNNSSVSTGTIDPTGSSLMGLNFPLKQQGEIGIGNGNGTDSIHQTMNVHTNLASSIESLSCMNQDLHWKLQQQRLAMLFGGGNGGGLDVGHDHDDQSKKGTNFLEIQSQKLQPILFQNLEISKRDGSSGGDGGGGDMATEWFFDNSYTANINSVGSRNLVQEIQKYGGNSNDDEDHNTTNWNNGIQAWNDLHQFSPNLP